MKDSKELNLAHDKAKKVIDTMSQNGGMMLEHLIDNYPTMDADDIIMWMNYETAKLLFVATKVETFMTTSIICAELCVVKELRKQNLSSKGLPS